MLYLSRCWLISGSGKDKDSVVWLSWTRLRAVFCCFFPLLLIGLWGCEQGSEEWHTDRVPVSSHRRLSGDREIEAKGAHSEAAAEIAPDGSRDWPQDSIGKGSDRAEDLAEHIAALENADPTWRAQVVQKIWILAADMGVTEEALEALDYLAAYDSDHVVAEKAARAVEDLRRLKEEANSTLFISDSEVATEEDYEQDQLEYGVAISAADGRYETPQYESNEEEQEPTQQEVISNAQVEELAEKALWDSSEANRYDAIQTLALYRSDAAVDVLIQASMDADARNRFEVIEALWLSAADGLDKDGNIWLYLQQAMDDSDERVSELAAKAIADLEHLEATQREAETALSSNDDHNLDLPMYNEDGSLTLGD